MSAATNRVVLVLHYGAGAEGVVGLEVAGKGGHGGHDDPDLERFVLLVGAEDAVDDCSADFVGDGMLFAACGGDEELN